MTALNTAARIMFAAQRAREYQQVNAMRIAVLLFAFSLCATAWAAPTLKVDSAVYSGPDEVRLIAPDGSTVWTCRRNPPEGCGPQPLCEAPADWFRGAGQYTLTYREEDRSEEVSTSFRVEGSEREVIWKPSALQATSIEPPDPRIVLKVSPESPWEAALTNGSEAPVWMPSTAPTLGLHFERLQSGEWKSGGVRLNASEWEVVAPGTTKRWSLLPTIEWLAEEGRYRAQSAVWLSDPNEGNDSKSLLRQLPVVSDPFDVAYGKTAHACLAERTLRSQEGEHKEAPALLTTSVGVLLLKPNGHLVRVDDGSMRIMAKLPESSVVRVGSIEDDLFVLGPRLMASRNGGRSFQTFGNTSTTRDDRLVWVGRKLLRFNHLGEAAWISTDGRVTPLSLPVKASWRTAAFSDERNGVLVGDCSVLLRTSDAGATWTKSPTPAPFIEWATRADGSLHLGGPMGQWTQRSREASFEKPKHRLATPDLPLSFSTRLSGSWDAKELEVALHMNRRHSSGRTSSRGMYIHAPRSFRIVDAGWGKNGAIIVLTKSDGVFQYNDGQLTPMLPAEAVQPRE